MELNKQPENQSNKLHAASPSPSSTTTKAAHTPGPWKEQRLNAELRIVAPHQGSDEDYDVATIDWNDEHASANARLIAAAPDFYSACINDEVPELTRLSALRALIIEVKRLGLANDEDPTATSETLTEVEELFEGLRAAIQKAKGSR